jgi:hypothetical protein
MALDVRDAVARVLFIPAAVEVFGDQAELDDQDAREIEIFDIRSHPGSAARRAPCWTSPDRSLPRPLASGFQRLSILKNLAAMSREPPFTRCRRLWKGQASDLSGRMAAARAFDCLSESLRPN